MTEHAQKAIANSGLRDGLCTVFVAHSTCGVTTIEFEPGCNADLARVMEQLAPTDDDWEHNERNADTNGHSHVRAAMIGPSVTIPFADGELCIGTWQKIVCIDFDDRPRATAPGRATARRLTHADSSTGTRSIASPVAPHQRHVTCSIRSSSTSSSSTVSSPPML